jgi:hypothetical protein
MLLQLPISALVRKQPSHKPESSMQQMPTHGERIAFALGAGLLKVDSLPKSILM